MTAAPVQWAQRKDTILITVRVFDAISPSVKSDSTSFTYIGQSANKEISYNQRIELYGEIVEGETKYVSRPRGTEIVLKKKDEALWWPRLAKTATKLHYVSVDWDKWVDSSDDEDEKPAFNWDPNEMGGMGDMGDMGGMDDMDDGCEGGDDCQCGHHHHHEGSDDDDGMEEVAPEPSADGAVNPDTPPPPVD